MKVILKKNINNLGKKGAVKDVSSGYGRNFLLPKGYAVLATTQGLNQAKEEKMIEEKKAEKDLAYYQEIINKIDGYELEIAAKTTDDHKLFGSIKPEQIAEKLDENGISLDKKYIKPENPIKEIGEHEVLLELPHNLEASIKVIITQEE